MTLPAGARLGPYEILSAIGAGGMGEVYRAKDPRLGREVAIKILPADLSRDADRMRRFEKEARAASALTHPNIVTIYDVMDSGSGTCIVMELISGRTIRELLADGAINSKQWLGIAAQAAEGLARAHASGIVHRDLKPENVMVTDDGFAKILDFGLAKLTQPEEAFGATEALTISRGTEPGLVMGTVGYMSPEQARGRALDFRSDQFSLGAIAYEMATGKRAFARESAPETLSAIIREEPEPMGAVAPLTPPPARWIVERCLSKDPQQRYASTQDLAREFASVRDHLSELSPSGPVVAAPVRRSHLRPVLGLAGALTLVALAGVLAGKRMALPPQPTFAPLTYRRGRVQSARFAPDGQSIVYSAAWDGKPARLFLKRSDSPDEVPISLPSANILSISKAGEMAIQLGGRSTHSGVWSGPLARAPITGGAARPIADDVQQADWAPDGENLVIARDVGGRGRLEFPIGKVLYETVGHTSFPRLSPKADRIAFVDHPLKTDDRGSVAIVDLAGHKQTLTREYAGIEGLVWSPAGDEIWFTGWPEDSTSSSLHAVSLTGRERLLVRLPEVFRIEDASSSGRLLITLETQRAGIAGRSAGETRERDLSWLNWSVVRDISHDGKTLLFDEEGGLSGNDYATCIRGMDGSPVVRLGEGSALALSPDGKWAIAQLNRAPFPLTLLATGSAERRILPTGGIHAEEVEWLDERRIVLAGSAAGRPMQLYVQDVGQGEPRAISTESVEASDSLRVAPSPDGRFVAAIGPDHKCRLYPVGGGAPRSIAALAEGESPEAWSRDGRWLFLRGPSASEPPARISRVDIESGRREPWKELMPADPAGLIVIGQVVLAPGGESYAYSYATGFSRLVSVEGIK